MDWGEEISMIMAPIVQRIKASYMWRFTMRLWWCLLHLLVDVVLAWRNFIHAVECYIISTGLLEKYQNLDLRNLRYLAIVVDSEEARDINKIKRLLRWLSSIGVKNVMLYDMEGVLKESLSSYKSSSDSRNASCWDSDQRTVALTFYEAKMTIELLSYSENKEGAAKAASYLCSRYLKRELPVSDKNEPILTEADMGNALEAVGCGRQEPDLLFIYGAARCHLGFPAWRMRYTEIVHMGPLRSMKHGAIVKAIYNFSRTQQNYGS